MYRETQDGKSIIRLSDGACIPKVMGNIDYIEYLDWVVKGGITEPYTQSINDYNAPILAELSEIDKSLPRGVEDLISVLAVDINALPQIQRDRLARKNYLRSQIKK